MAKRTDVNFDYIPRLRYIIEIQTNDWDEPLFTRRICGIKEAKKVRDSYRVFKGIEARLHDTKTGDIL